MVTQPPVQHGERRGTNGLVRNRPAEPAGGRLNQHLLVLLGQPKSRHTAGGALPTQIELQAVPSRLAVYNVVCLTSCLSIDQAAIGTTCYIALDKGALSWGPSPHVLVIPIDHHSASAALPAATLSGKPRPELFQLYCFTIY